jgi:hypothetical protein
LRQVIAETLSRAPEQRPSLDQWDAALAQAIAVTPHRPPPQPPPPITTPTPTVVITPPSQPGLPPLPPQAPVSAAPQASSSNRNTWLLVAGGLLLVVLLPMIITNLNKSTTTSSSTTRTATDYPSSSTTTFAPDGPVNLPASAVFCGRSGGGRFTRAAKGTTVTSCPFAEAVRDAVNASGVGFPRIVRAYSPVMSRYYDMDCVGGSPIVTCTGGNDAVVYVY